MGKKQQHKNVWIIVSLLLPKKRIKIGIIIALKINSLEWGVPEQDLITFSTLSWGGNTELISMECPVGLTGQK